MCSTVLCRTLPRFDLLLLGSILHMHRCRPRNASWRLPRCTLHYYRKISRRIFSEKCLLPVQNKGFIVTTIAVVGGVLASISVALRLYARLSRQGGKMMMDDITVISTLVLVIPTSAAAITAVGYGLGQDIWMLTPSEITSFFKVFYVAEALYALCVFFAKTNFLFFYLRVFPGEKFCSITRLLIGVCLAAGVSLSTATVFQCTPVSYAWTRWDGEHEGKCQSINLQTWTNAAINIVLDVVILAMPITQLVRVMSNFHWKEKLGAVLMFALGFLYHYHICHPIADNRVISDHAESHLGYFGDYVLVLD